MTFTPERDSLGAYIKRFFPPMIFAPHHQKLINVLRRVEQGEIKRVIVSIPPRHGKSLIISEHFPAWYLGRNPSKQIAVATYGQALSEKFGRKIKAQVTTDEYKAIFPDANIRADACTSRNIETETRGIYLATSIGGQLTGSGADLMVVDDPIKDRQEAESETVKEAMWDWWISTARTRIMPGGAIVVVQTRWIEDDLAGRLLANDDSGEWLEINFPALDGDTPLWPEFYDLDSLLSIRKDVGEYEFNALYQGNPQPADGNILSIKRIQYCDELPEDFSRVIQIADTAIKEGQDNDYSVITTLGLKGQNVYEIDQWRDKVASPALKRAVQLNYEKHRPSLLLIEDKASGQQLVQELSSLYPVKAVKATTDKVERAGTLSDVMEVGRIWLQKGLQRNNDTISEMAGFPNAKHDDIVDTWSYGVRELVRSEILPLIGDLFRYDDHVHQTEDKVPITWKRFRSMCWAPNGRTSVIWWAITDMKQGWGGDHFRDSCIAVFAEHVFERGMTPIGIGSLTRQLENKMELGVVSPGPAGTMGDVELWPKVGPGPMIELNQVGAKYIKAIEDEPTGWAQIRQRLYSGDLIISSKCETLIQQIQHVVADPKNKEVAEYGQHIEILTAFRFVCNAYKRKKEEKVSKLKSWSIN